MTEHATEIETVIEGLTRNHRWKCTCGQVGVWKVREFQAKQGASRHVQRSRPA